MDKRIVILAQQGDRDAFAELVEEMGNRLHAIAQGIVRDIGLAEDATQQALLEIWRDLPKLKDPSRFDAWSYRLVVRASYSEARRVKRRLKNVVGGSAMDPFVADGSNLVADRDQLERAFEQLSLDHRTVIVLRHYIGMPLEEIAATLEIPIDTARSRIYHGMRALRAAMDADARSTGPMGRHSEAPG